MLENFIAYRYLISKKEINFISIISLISFLGITIGVAALVIVISVFNGFGSLVTNRLISFDPHLRIIWNNTNNQSKNELEKLLDSDSQIIFAEDFAENKIILTGNSQYKLVNFKGIRNSHSNWGIKTAIKTGKFPRYKNGTIPEILISRYIAGQLSVFMGDTITVTNFSEVEHSLLGFAIPRSFNFRISGIFSTNNLEYDGKYAFVEFNTYNKYGDIKNAITGKEIRLEKPDYAEILKQKLQHIFPENEYQTWFDLHNDLYIVMEIERWAAFLILALIIAVATFNILGSLSMTALEKKKDIAILRSLGFTKKSVSKIFLRQGLLIGISATLLGLVVGLIICWLQIEFKFYSLDASQFIIDSIPVEINFFDLIYISFASVLLTFFASLYPAKKAIKTSIIDAIKWE